MAHAIKLSFARCTILLLILILPFASLSSPKGETDNIIFTEDFEGTSLDPQKWIFTENTNMSGYPANGGSISVADGFLELSSSGSSFPFIYSAENPFPSSGDFEIEFAVKYTCIADLGCGVMISNGVPAVDTNWHNYKIITLWAHDQGPSNTVIYMEFYNSGIYSSYVHGFKPSSAQHIYKVSYSDGVYSIYVDGEFAGRGESEERPNMIVFGNPPNPEVPRSPQEVAVWGYWGWSSFKIDYVRVSSGAKNGEESADPGLMVWWKLDEGAGTVVSDASGNNYQGIIQGATWTEKQGSSFLYFDGLSDYVSLPSLNLLAADSLSVVAWIYSDLAEVGVIIYNGNYGEFGMNCGDTCRENQHLNLNPDHAMFSVKLSDSKWYGIQSSSPMEPNMWHQIIGIWEKGVSVKVYVDGALDGENNNISNQPLYNPTYWYPSSLGIYGQDLLNNTCFFKGLMSNVMIFDRTLTNEEIGTLYTTLLPTSDEPITPTPNEPTTPTPNEPTTPTPDESTTPTLAKPTLEVLGKSASSHIGFNVEIKGSLTINETAIPESPILLSYSVDGGKTSEKLTLVYTSSDGGFSASWLPSVTGNYLIQAEYEGNGTYLETEATASFAVISFTDKDVFWVTSNSTVSSLVFDSENQELSFAVAGPSGTIGYVDAWVAKNIIDDVDYVKAYIDGSEVECTTSSVQGSWLIHLTYQHSSHEVLFSLGSKTSKDLVIAPESALTTVLVFTGIVAATTLLSLRKKGKA